MSALGDLAQREAARALCERFNICGDDRGCLCEDAHERAAEMAAAALGALASPEVVQGIAEEMWESIDDQGIRGRLYREDCDYLAAVVVAALTGEGAS